MTTILIYLCFVALTVYVDAVACLSAKHKLNWKASLISALFFPVLWVVVIVAVVKETEDF